MSWLSCEDLLVCILSNRKGTGPTQRRSCRPQPPQYLLATFVYSQCITA